MFDTLFDNELKNVNIRVLHTPDAEGNPTPTDFAYFTYGEAIYAAKLENGKLPTAPEKWNVIVQPSQLFAVPDYEFYYENTEVSRDLRASIYDVYNQLTDAP